MAWLYIVTNSLTDVHYIGWTKETPLVRWKQHIQTANKNSQLYFHRALRTYGRDTFLWEAVQEFETWEEAKQAEMFWIDYGRDRGIELYNLTDGGEGSVGRICSNITKKRIGNALKGKLAHENHPWVKLCWRDIAIIRRLLTLGVSVRFCYTHFGVSKPLIRGIQHGRTWKSSDAPLLSNEEISAIIVQAAGLFEQFQKEEEEKKKAYKLKYPDCYCEVCGKFVNRQGRQFCSSICCGKFQSAVNWDNTDLAAVLEGRTIAEVATLLGCSATNIRNNMKKQNITRPLHTKEHGTRHY